MVQHSKSLSRCQPPCFRSWKWHTTYCHVTVMPDTQISMLHAYILKQYNFYSMNIGSSLECKHFSQPSNHWNGSYKGCVVFSLQCTSFDWVCMVGLHYMPPLTNPTLAYDGEILFVTIALPPLAPGMLGHNNPTDNHILMGWVDTAVHVHPPLKQIHHPGG